MTLTHSRFLAPGPGALIADDRPREFRPSHEMFVWRLRCVSLLAALLFGDASCLHAQGTEGLSAALALEQSLTQLIEQTEPSVVSIARFRSAPETLTPDGRILAPGLNANPDVRQEMIPNQFATGVIVAPAEGDERFVLTVYHAVRGGPIYGVNGSGNGSRLEVRFTSRHACPAAILAADPRSDLAVLKLDLKSTNLRFNDLRPMAWRTSQAVRKGQLVITLGNPYWIARDGSPSAGWAMVGNLGRRPVALAPLQGGPKTLDGLGGLIHLDARLPIGSSGSPVVNLTGQLVGVTTSLAAVEGYERSSGFALPIDPATHWIIDDLLAGYEVEYGFLGIHPGIEQQLSPDVTSQPSAAKAVNVQDLSPAHDGGLRRDDVILAVDGEPTLTDLDLMRQVTMHPPGSVVKLTVVRRGVRDKLTLSIKLGKWPAAEDEAIIATKRRWPLWRGMGVDYSTGRSNFLGPTLEIRPGVLVSEVRPGSPAEAALLEPGVFVSHVNRAPVNTPAEFAAAVQETAGGVVVRVIAADNSIRTVTIAEE